MCFPVELFFLPLLLFIGQLSWQKKDRERGMVRFGGQDRFVRMGGSINLADVVPFPQSGNQFTVFSFREENEI